MKRIVLLKDNFGSIVIYAGVPADRFQRHELVRQELSVMLDTPTEELTICYGESGKPYLAEPNARLHFNYAYREPYLALITRWDQSVGIDLEILSYDLPLLTLAEDHFAHEEAALLKQIVEEKEHTELFFRLWTLKEAYLKAAGYGIVAGLQIPCWVPTTQSLLPSWLKKTDPHKINENFKLSWIQAEDEFFQSLRLPPSWPSVVQLLNGLLIVENTILALASIVISIA